MSSTYIIAEAGVNHNGSLHLALELVKEAAKAGADAVKFQTFITERTITKNAEKASYQKETTGNFETQFEMVKKLELKFEDFKIIQNHCIKNNIQFLSTAFDLESLDYLVNELNVNVIKIPSGDINNAPLVLQAARSQKDILLSTGMSTIEEIHQCLAIIYYGYTYPNKTPNSFEEVYNHYLNADTSIIQEKVTILQCTTEYPTPVEELNLNSIKHLKREFSTKVGFSDHSDDIYAPSLAVSLGATVIEKHFTLDNEMEGPDHKASLNPKNFKRMVDLIRYTEKALGSEEKIITESEKANKKIARKSLVASEHIKKGMPFTEKNLGIKRPGNGINPLLYWDYLGKVAIKDYKKDDLIQE